MQFHRDKRQFARLDTEHSLKIVGSDGGTFPALAVDVSLSGLQVLCDRPTALRISPSVSHGVTEPQQEIQVKLALPTPEGRIREVGAFCKLITIRRLAEDEYRLGLRYLRFENDCYQILENYIDQAMGDG